MNLKKFMLTNLLSILIYSLNTQVFAANNNTLITPLADDFYSHECVLLEEKGIIDPEVRALFTQ